MKQQIPTELRDVIGMEEMLRMSNIFIGSGLKSDDLYKKINQLIQNRNSKKPSDTDVIHEDEMTLKSIKRW